MQQTPNARRSEADGVLTITFTRPDKYNAVTADMLDLLRAAVDDLEQRDDLRVLLITGEGKYFTAGMDITTMQNDSGEKFRGSKFRLGYKKLHDLFDRFEGSEKPIVLAAQGPCLGLGVEMSTSCDYRLASDTALFGLPEVPNLAVVPGSGGVSRLTRIIGPHWTSWIALAGENVSAADARMMGLVHAVYPQAEFAEKAHAFAVKLAGLSQEALGVGKLAVHAAMNADRKTARDFDRVMNTVLVGSEEFQAKVRAFAERSARKAK